MKILRIVLLCLCLLLQISCLRNPDTKEARRSGTETALTGKNMTDTESEEETTAAASETRFGLPHCSFLSRWMFSMPIPERKRFL